MPISDRAIRILIFAKGFIILAAALIYFKVVKIGDLQLLAEDAKVDAENAQAAAPAAPAEGAADPAAMQKLAANTEALPQEVAAENVAKKSLLQELLDLPKLDPDHLKKDEVARYLNLIESKQEQLENRLAFLNEKEGQLTKVEQSIDVKLKKLEEERDFFAQTVQKEKQLQKERLTMLIDMYKKMEPKKAAPVFEGMNRDLAIALFNGIEQKQITRILEVMNPQKAIELSEYFGRIRSGKEYEVLKDINQSLLKEFEECKAVTR